MKKVRFTLSVLFLLCISLSAIAQNKITLRGTVVDNTNQSVIGASVVEKGTTNGTVTDVNGKFVLNVSSSSAIIQISYIGFDRMEIPASSITGTKKIQLKESAVALGEVVAIGYGQVKKKDATGSVTAIKADEINRGVVTSPQELLLGKAPGVVVTTDGGAPGTGATIRIRGGASLNASNDPLVVIDGVPVDNSEIKGMSNPLSTIHPNDIETFTVLKDASATAIYGSRASNGVIIITTKTGSAGAAAKPTVSYGGSVHVSTRYNSVDVLDGDQFRAIYTQKWGTIPAAMALLGSANTNWQDQIFRTAFSTDHNLGVSGKFGKNLPYRFSGSFTDENGILKTSSMQRSTVSANLNPTFLDNHLKVNASVKGMYIKNRFADKGAIGSAITFDPTQPVYSDNMGTKIGNGYFTWLKASDKTFIDVAPLNPLSMLEQRKDESNAYRSLGNIQLDYKMHFLPDLKANLNLGYDLSKSDGTNQYYDNAPNSWKLNDKKGVGETTDYSQIKRNLLLDFYLNYVKEVSSLKSRFDVMGGYSYQKFYKKEETETITSSGKITSPNKVTPSEYVLLSFFGRFNYSLMDRYLLTATLRNDQTSRFSPDTRSGLFPSVGLAWKISEEPFLKDQKTISDLKLRLGYGITGQQDLNTGDYPYIATYTISSGYYADYPLGNAFYHTARAEGYDPKLKWEETTTYNIGLDCGILNGRFTGSIDIYSRDTKDLINKIPMPAGSNLTNEILTNVGSLTNKGIEFAISGKPISTKNVTWDLGFNISHNVNELTKLNYSNNPNYYIPTGNIGGGTGNTIQAQKVGFPINSYLVYEQVYDKNGTPIEGMYVDRNRDGKIDASDMYCYHSPAPKVSMSLSSKLLYHNWDFSFSLRSNLGNYVYDNVEAGQSLVGTYVSTGYTSSILDRGTYFNKVQYLTDHYVRNASFLRCDNITLGYAIDKIKNMKMRVYGTVQNPFVITKYTGLDPEVFNGIDNNVYPRPLTFLIGVSLSL
ncbi:MAG: TonB-dependent receptor [Bacteroidota bacterium]|nr:TonB-dependent receptor [Bacteroidota bacterium]